MATLTLRARLVPRGHTHSQGARLVPSGPHSLSMARLVSLYGLSYSLTSLWPGWFPLWPGLPSGQAGFSMGQADSLWARLVPSGPVYSNNQVHSWPGCFPLGATLLLSYGHINRFCYYKAHFRTLWPVLPSWARLYCLCTL